MIPSTAWVEPEPEWAPGYPPPAARPVPPADVPVDRPARPSRTLLGYLVMPRPKDLFKAALLPVTFGIGVLGAGGASGTTIVRALVVLVALELLIYPARYQWNDIRGFVADQHHPGERDRGRLPGPLHRARPHVLLSCWVAVARLAVTAALALLLPGLRLGGMLAAVTVGVFGVAIAYEALRAVGTGRTGQVPPPLHPAVVGLWIVAGAGYVVRGMAGLALAVDLGRRPALAVAAVVTLWAFGTAFVTSRWAVEATAFARVHRGEVRWTARAEHAREHLLGLVRWLPTRVTGPDPGDGFVRGPLDWAALRGRTSLLAPWNLAMFVVGVAAAVTGRLLVGPATAADLAVTGSIGGLAVIAAAVLADTRPLWVIAGATALALTAVVLDASRPTLAALPWLAVMIAYLSFSQQSLRSLGRPGRLRPLLAAVLTPAVRAVVGRPTWNALVPQPERRA